MSGSRKIEENEIAALAASVKAPESLHRRVREMVQEAQEGPSAKRRHWKIAAPRIAVAAAGACALAVAAIVAVLPGAGSGSLTVQSAAAVALGRPIMPAPPESPTEHAQLRMAVEGVAFPYWAERYGWRSTGARVDTIAGRSVTTVFYTDSSNQRIGYAIASGRSPSISGGVLRWQRGVPYRVLRQDGAVVVAWPRKGHLCVVSGRGIGAATLLRLAGGTSGTSA